jgi:hypothetical protein
MWGNKNRSGTMNLFSNLNAISKMCSFVAVICLVIPTILSAQDSDGDSKRPPEGADMSSPFKITKKSEFACAEVNEVVIGGLASHEITVDPKRVERCNFKKVGSRLHDCKKLKIKNATADWYGVVTLDTDGGPVKFTFQELGDDAGDKKRVMVWTWPDSDKKYVCTAITSRR